MKVAILLLNYNGKKDTLECLSSLEALNYPSYDVIIADNGSTDGSIQAIKQAYPDITLLDNRENLGFAEGNNVLIRHALEKKFDAFFLLNNDTVVEPDLLDHLVLSAKKNKHAIFGPKIYLYSDRQTLDHLGGNWNDKKGAFDLIASREVDNQKRYETQFEVDYVCGCALFAPREVFEKVGLFDPRYFLFWEESDFCKRAKDLGIKSMVCPKSKVYHKVSASFSGGKAHTTYFWWRNRLLWIEKNLSPLKRKQVYQKVVTKEIIKLYRHSFFTSIQYALLGVFSKKSKQEKKEKLLRFKAAKAGIRDYAKRRFYNAPTWVFNKKS